MHIPIWWRTYQYPSKFRTALSHLMNWNTFWQLLMSIIQRLHLYKYICVCLLSNSLKIEQNHSGWFLISALVQSPDRVISLVPNLSDDIFLVISFIHLIRRSEFNLARKTFVSYATLLTFIFVYCFYLIKKSVN